MLRNTLGITLVLSALLVSLSVAQEENASADQSIRGIMKLKLRDNLELSGTPIDLDTIEMTSLVGKVNLPVHTIAGIRFAQGPDEQTTVVLLNGDALTGEINLPQVAIVSEWGEANVNVANVVSVVFRDDLAWSGVATPDGKRWRLTKVRPTGGRHQPKYYKDRNGRR